MLLLSKVNRQKNVNLSTTRKRRVGTELPKGFYNTSWSIFSLFKGIEGKYR
jgi:hypothetical protein